MILISIGANLPGMDGAPALVTCQRAAAALDALPGMRLYGLSRWYETAPVLPAEAGLVDQPRYVNGVAELRTEPCADVDPALLLAQLQTLEAAAGRVRSAPNAARVLDLDIVAMDGLLRESPDPVLPHPRMHQRAFVLVPLAELAPGWVHPRLRLTPGEMLMGLPSQDVRPL